MTEKLSVHQPLQTLLFFLLVALPPATPSPVAYILHMNGFSPISVLTSSLVVTERLFLTPKFPVFTVPKSGICVLAVPNLKDFSEGFIRRNCRSIKKVHFSESTSESNAASIAALVETERPITFVSGVEAAMIPAVTSIEQPLKLNANCQIVYQERKHRFGYVTSQKLQSVTITEGANDTVSAKLASPRKYCVQDNGLPLYCEAAVVGMFVYSTESNVCCVSECQTTSDVEALKLYSEEIQGLLKEFVPPA